MKVVQRKTKKTPVRITKKTKTTQKKEILEKKAKREILKKRSKQTYLTTLYLRSISATSFKIAQK